MAKEIKITEINVFVASSLMHDEARKRIADIMEENNGKGVKRISTYLHEKNGIYSLRPGVDSQQLINAEALSTDCFILYVGDYIGKHTIEEFNNIMHNCSDSYTFIYVLHNKDEHIEQPVSENYIPWEEFESKYLTSAEGGANYYEKQTDGESFAEVIREIREEILNKRIVPLPPSKLDYNAMLSRGQRGYRQEGDFYYLRESDERLAEAIESKESPFTLVYGLSLSGKTRGMIRALKNLPEDYRIHFLRGTDGMSATTALKGINCGVQFPDNSRNILFIDEIDSLLLKLDKQSLSEDGEPEKIGEIMSYADENPERLKVFATTNMDPATLVSLLSRISYSENWLPSFSDSSRMIEIPSMRAKEMRDIYRELRARNLISREDMPEIADGMPIGALFIELRKVKQKYNALLASSPNSERLRNMFHAIKLLGLWKRTSVNDFNLLLDVLRTIDEEGGWNEALLFERMKEAGNLISAFVTYEKKSLISRPKKSYGFSVEEIIRNEVFRFRDQPETGKPSGYDYQQAIGEAAGYILSAAATKSNDRIILYRDLKKLFTKAGYILEGKKELEELYAALLEEIPMEEILATSQKTPTIGGEETEWVDLFLGVWAHNKLTAEGGEREVREIYDRRPSQPLLGELLAWERKKGCGGEMKIDLFDEGGQPREEYRKIKSDVFLYEMFERMDFDQTVGWISRKDYVGSIRGMLPKWLEDSLNFDSILREKLSQDIIYAAQKIKKFEQVGLLLDAVASVERRVSGEAGKHLYESEEEKLLMVIPIYAWNCISKRIPSGDLHKLFEIIIPLDVKAEGKGLISTMLLNKRKVLNDILELMPSSDAIKSWERMKGLRDSFALRVIISKSRDYSEAKGLFSSFMETDYGKGIKVTDIILNPLLQKAQNYGDVLDAENMFLRYGLLKEGETLLDIRDVYTMGILYNIERLNYDERLDMVRRQRSEEGSRGSGTLGCLINRAKRYSDARMILFEEKGLKWINPTEQEELRESPVVLSFFFAKGKNEREGEEQRKTFEGLLARWKEEEREESEEGKRGRLDEMLGNENANIIAAVLRNRWIYRTYGDCVAILERIKEIWDGYRTNIYIERVLAERYCQGFKDEHDPQLIAYLNDFVLRYSSAERKQVWRNINLRTGHHTNSLRIPYNLDYVEPFPYIGEGKEWEIREVTTREFLLNMLRHRFLHPKMLNRLMWTYVGKLSANGADKEALYKELDEIVDLAIANRTFLSQKAYTEVGNNLLSRGYKLSPAVAEFSAMETVTKFMTLGIINPKEAEEGLSREAQLSGRAQMKTQSYYDTVITWERKQCGATVDSMLRMVRELPEGIRFSTQMYFTIANLVENREDFRKLKEAYGKPLPYNGFKFLISSDAKIMDGEERDALIRLALGYDAGDINPSESMDENMVTALLAKLGSIGIAEKIEIVRRYGLRFNEPSFHHLLFCVWNLEEFKMIEEHLPEGRWTANLIGGMISSVRDLLIDEDSLTRTEGIGLFEYFNNEENVNEWHTILETEPKEGIYEKVYNTLTSYFKEFRNSEFKSLKRFAYFCRTVIGNSGRAEKRFRQSNKEKRWKQKIKKK